MKLMRASRRLYGSVNEATGDSATRGASDAVHLGNALLLRADEPGVLLCIEAAVPHTRGHKQNAAFNNRAVYSYAAFLLRELRKMDSTACEKCPIHFDAFLLTKIP